MNAFRVIMPTTGGISSVRTIEGRIQRVWLNLEVIESGIIGINMAGRLDIFGVLQIEEDLKKMILKERSSVIVDLSQVDLLSSVGLGMLISNANTLRSYGKRMILLNPQPRVEKVIRTACDDQHLPIEYDLIKALNRIKCAA